jgi:UDP-N-acetylglucosamine transferase subunit ALG13
MRVSIAVSAGTDFHRFDRLIEWIDSWMRQHGAEVDLFVQHGSSRPSEFGENVEMVSQTEMLERYRAATVVITQGGPGGILDAASVGLLPIVVPRRPDLGEHVDGHQIAFADFMARSGQILLAQSEQELHAALSAAVAAPESMKREPRIAPVEHTAELLEQVVEDVMSRPVHFLHWSRLRASTPRRRAS